MSLIKNAPFERQHFEKKSDTFNVRLNEEERRQFNEAKKVINQVKDATAMKQLAFIGIANVLFDKKTNQILDIIINNKRKNARLGVADFD